MMIRENVIKKIDYDLCKKWMIKKHCNGISYETLEVYSDGSLVECEEPSSNTWHTNTCVLTHTYGVHCNCDWCAEWENNEDAVQEEFDCKKDFIEECIYNNDDGSFLLSVVDKVKEIPYGFFNDEKEDEENDKNRSIKAKTL